jgi:hypothetical protein
MTTAREISEREYFRSAWEWDGELCEEKNL